MSWLGPFLLLLGPLVVLHELGHFLIARWFNVRCDQFAIGIGPALFRFRSGETEYVIGCLPLGGYVKMLGGSPDEELSPQERARSFLGQTPLRRILISLGGPAMNLAVAVVVLAGVLMTLGWPGYSSRIGSVEPGSAAERAGLRSADRVVAIDDQPVTSWRQLQNAVAATAEGETLQLVVERAGTRQALDVQPARDPRTGAAALGVLPFAADPLLVFRTEDAPGPRAGLRDGDRITAVQGEPAPDRSAAEAQLARVQGPLTLDVERPAADGATSRLQFRIEPDAGAQGWSLEALGAIPVIDFAVADAVIGGPARAAGLAPGDIVWSVAGQRVTSLARMQALVQESQGAALPVRVLRNGQLVDATITPQLAPALEGEAPRFQIGILPSVPTRGGEEIREQARNPLVALALGAGETWRIVTLTVDSLWKLLTARASLEGVSGPIGIGQIAVQAFNEPGWFTFLHVFALISVNLGIFNLLPVPVLDGGQILFSALEAIKGSPLGMRAREISQGIGFAAIAALMGIAFWNDLVRNWQAISGFLSDLL